MDEYDIRSGVGLNHFEPFEIISDATGNEYHFAVVKPTKSHDVQLWDLDTGFQISTPSGEAGVIQRLALQLGITEDSPESTYRELVAAVKSQVTELPVVGIAIPQRLAMLLVALIAVGLGTLLANDIRYLLSSYSGDSLDLRTERWLLLDALPIVTDRSKLVRLSAGAEWWLAVAFHLTGIITPVVLAVATAISYHPRLYNFEFSFWASTATSLVLGGLVMVAAAQAVVTARGLLVLHRRVHADLYSTGVMRRSMLAALTIAGCVLAFGGGIYINETSNTYYVIETDRERQVRHITTWALSAATIAWSWVEAGARANYLRPTVSSNARRIGAAALSLVVGPLYVAAAWLIPIGLFDIVAFISMCFVLRTVRRRHTQVPAA